MTADRATVAIAIAAISFIAMICASGCDGRDPAGNSDAKEQPREKSPAAAPPTAQPTDTTPPRKAPGAPLAVVNVPDGTLEGEWLEVGGYITPYLWCYRHGRRLDFSQDGPRIYMAVDGGEYEMVGIVVRSKEDADLLSKEAEASTKPLMAWVYSAHLPSLKRVQVPEKVDAIQVWEFDYALLQDLSPLEHFGDLKSLSLRDCEAVVDLAPLTKLTKLISLDLTGCDSVTSGDKLTGLGELRSLALGLPSDTDMTFISSLPKLRHLDLGTGYVADFGFLAATRDLESLAANAYQGGESLSKALAGLPKLRRLHLQGTRKVALPPSLSNLRSLELDYCGQFDFTRVQHLTSLTSLTCNDLRGGPLDLRPLAHLKNLEQLSLFHPHMRRWGDNEWWQLDLAPLGSLTRLKSLEIKLEGKLRTSLIPLGKLRSLEELDIDVWDLPSITAIAKLTALRRLRLHVVNPGFRDLEPIAGLPELLSLDLGIFTILQDQPKATPLVTALPSMRKLRRLRTLRMEGSDIADISAVAELPALRDLEMVDYLVKDFSALERLPQLRRLVIDKGCPAAQLARIIAKQPALEELRIESLVEDGGAFSSTAKDHSDVLRKLKNLRHLRIKDLPDLSPLEEMTDLVSVEIRNTRSTTLKAVGNLPHLRSFDGRLFITSSATVAEAQGKVVDFAAPLEQLDELLMLRGVLNIKNVERQVSRGTKIDSTGVEELRRVLLRREHPASP